MRIKVFESLLAALFWPDWSIWFVCSRDESQVDHLCLQLIFSPTFMNVGYEFMRLGMNLMSNLIQHLANEHL